MDVFDAEQVDTAVQTNSSLGVIRFPSRILVSAISLAAVVTVSACGGSDRVPVNTVSGKVLLRGKPAAGATVRFIAVNPTKAASAIRPIGIVRENGSFSVATYDFGDGAPTGKYGVIITWPTPDALTEPGEIPKDYIRLEKEYGDAKNPKFHAVVESGSNQLDAFELK